MSTPPDPPHPQSRVLQPVTRHVDVARAYVEGLERDRAELRKLEEAYDHQIWEMIQLSAYAKALYTALYQLRVAFEAGRVTTNTLDIIDEILDSERSVYDEVWSCECGHSKYLHDPESGRCQYLGCKNICG
jgi:hypothetical protein